MRRHRQIIDLNVQRRLFGIDQCLVGGLQDRLHGWHAEAFHWKLPTLPAFNDVGSLFGILGYGPLHVAVPRYPTYRKLELSSLPELDGDRERP